MVFAVLGCYYHSSEANVSYSISNLNSDGMFRIEVRWDLGIVLLPRLKFGGYKMIDVG